MKAGTTRGVGGLYAYYYPGPQEEAVMREVEQIESTEEFVSLLPPSVRRALLEVPLKEV